MPPRRKLTLRQLGRCAPQTVRNGEDGVKSRCLPASVYRAAAKGKRGSPYAAAGCEEGADHCILDHADLPVAETKRLRRTLRVRRPASWDAKPNQWLDNFNIAGCMRQYEAAVPWFRFIGVFPIDFSAPNPYQKGGAPQCLNRELCTLKLRAEYEKGRRGLGAVFNLDPHYKGGSHWVALYIDLHDIEAPLVSYFDSYGMRTPPMIARLMRSFTLQIPGCQLAFNARRFQFGNSECGMFSMYFLICMMHGISFREFCKDTVKDGFMLELRKVLFSK
jgi:hypothetical protein